MASATSTCRRLQPASFNHSSAHLTSSLAASPPDLPAYSPSRAPVSNDFPASNPPSTDRSASPGDDFRPSGPPTTTATLPRNTRFPRSCNSRPSAAAPRPPPTERQSATRREKEEAKQGVRVIAPLVQAPSPSQLPRWVLRSMWEFASILNFLHVFRPLLNILVEFSAEELETALITPNRTLDDVHIPLLKAIPPVTRMALGRATWVTVLCRKLRDWWHWVADGEIPIVASHGTEIETYKILDPRTRILILKALCDIRVEQEDIRNYMDDSLKRGIQLSVFRKERVGGDSHGISYWYEDDPIIGHRLYREIRQVEVKKVKARGSLSSPLVSFQWEAVATNLDEFEEASDKLFSSKNRTEISLGKKLKFDFLPKIEKIHKKQEKLLKKQHREALLLDSFVTADGLFSGRSLRDRKPVTYTFDDYDRSISEAIKITKKRQSSPEDIDRSELLERTSISANGKMNSSLQIDKANYGALPPKSNNNGETDMEDESLDRSNRRRKRPQRFSEKDFVDTVSAIDADFDSEDDIVGEAVYDEEYLKNRKQRRVSSGSEGDEEYHWEEEENADDEDEEEYSLSSSEDIEQQRHPKKSSLRTRQERKLRSVDEFQTGLRRSRRSTRPRVNYQQYELSDSDAELSKPGKSNETEPDRDPELSISGELYKDENGSEEITDKNMNKNYTDHSRAATSKEQQQDVQKIEDNGQDGGVKRARLLDLNELAPGTGFDDGPIAEDEGADNF